MPQDPCTPPHADFEGDVRIDDLVGAGGGGWPEGVPRPQQQVPAWAENMPAWGQPPPQAVSSLPGWAGSEKEQGGEAALRRPKRQPRVIRPMPPIDPSAAAAATAAAVGPSVPVSSPAGFLSQQQGVDAAALAFSSIALQVGGLGT